MRSGAGTRYLQYPGHASSSGQGSFSWLKLEGYINTLAAGLSADINAWSFIFMGAGVIVLLGVLFRLLVPEYKRPVTGNIILGLILIGIGLGDLFNWAVVWALILILIGISIIFRGFRRGRDEDTGTDL